LWPFAARLKPPPFKAIEDDEYQSCSGKLGCDAENERADGLKVPHCDTMGSVSLHGFQAQSIDSASVILQEAQGLRV
jgi:hypothetical protein